MTKIITVCNSKGGVGKTTSVMNIAAHLMLFGKRVLVVDFDPQANTTSGLGFSTRDIGKSVYDVLMRRENPQKALLRKQFHFDVLPSSPDLAGATVELVNEPQREFKLHHALRNLHHNYDFIFIDTPPSLGLLTINALVAADYVLIPAQAEYYSLEGLAQLLATVEMIKKNLVRSPKIMGVFLTMYDEGNRLNRAVRDEVRKNFPGHVFDTQITRSVELAEAPGFGKTILEYSPESQGAKEYYALAREVEEIL